MNAATAEAVEAIAAVEVVSRSAATPAKVPDASSAARTDISPASAPTRAPEAAEAALLQSATR